MKTSGCKYKKLLIVLLTIVSLFLLSGCSRHIIQERPVGAIEIDRIKPGTEAPLMDAEIQEETKAIVYYYNSRLKKLEPSIVEAHTMGGTLDFHELLDKQIKISIEEEESVFEDIGLNNKAPLFSAVFSDQIAIVDLPSILRMLDPELLYGFRQSIAQTLCAAGLGNVIVLIGGREEGVDLAGLLPAGVFTKTIPNEVTALYEQANEIRQTQMSFSRKTLFYLPSIDGTLLIPSVRDVNYDSASLIEYLYSILEEFSQINRSNPLHKFPEPLLVLEEMPEIVRSADGNYRVVSLHLSEQVSSELKEAGLCMQIYLAMLTNTLMCFVPGIDGVQITIGDNTITELSAEDMVTGNTAMTFQDGLLTWECFKETIGVQETIYQAGVQNGLQRINIEVPAQRDKTIRTRLEKLFSVWSQEDGLQDIGDSDIIATRSERKSIVLNLSDNISERITRLDENMQRLFIYAIVNTVTEGRQQNSVIFFFDGKQINGQSVILRGRVYRNPGIFQR